MFRGQRSDGASPAEKQFWVFAVYVIVHESQQKRPHNICVILQFAVKCDCEQRREIDFGPGVKIRAALERSDELETEKQRLEQCVKTIERNLNLTSSILL